MLDLDLLKEHNPHQIIIKELEWNNIIISLTNQYWEKVINTLLNTLSSVNRWETEWLQINKIETNREHVLEMLYLTHLFFTKYPELSKFLNFEIICIKIALHDLWEVWTWDITIDQKEWLSKDELLYNTYVELDFWIRIINILKKENININNIRNLERHYLDYEKNKSNNKELNDYFVKFLDKYQALLFIVNHIPEFENFERYSINTIFQELKKRNNSFKEKWIDLLKNFESIINQKEVNESDIKKCLRKNS